MRLRRLLAVVAGGILAAVGVIVIVGVGAGRCVDGPAMSSCVTGPEPVAIVAGVVCIGVGLLLAFRWGRARR